ncbi:MAG: type II toxin-antitoxin system RelE/ParE family toxin [Thermodesulfovibrionia bacterium]|nr:type II toxin-antitoxin system RelE/ParE family toxin [Thermodesulfovibrionia bacterium]
MQKLDKPIAKRILTKISWFSQHFNNITPEPLSGEMAGTFKVRVGDWRIVYTIEKDVIVIQAVGHRREIYSR